MTSRKNRTSIGIDFSSVCNFDTAVASANEVGYNQCYIPISHPRYRREFSDSDIIESYDDGFSRSIIAVQSLDYMGYVRGKLSDHINVDSSNETFRKYSETVFEQEMKWCTYLSMPHVMLTLPVEGPFVNLARLVYSKIRQSLHTPSFFVRVPMVSPCCEKAALRGSETFENDSWSRWNEFRTYCCTEKKVLVALELADDLPDPKEISRWLGEPIGCLLIKAKSFQTNARGYPVLSKAHQQVVKQFILRETPFVLTGSAPEDLKPLFVQYLTHLIRLQTMTDQPIHEDFYKGYEDCLQIPLQPLMDNLDQYTYEVFEKDPVKYREYRRAIKLALLDKKDGAGDSPLVVMVVGAGRGPIVEEALTAAEEADVQIRLFAIEKNPNAIVSLQMKKMNKWHDRVTIVATDMRYWKTTEKADIMVSELLGSFGDNELSPECLDGAQSFLKEDGISIPSSYTSYICPTQTHKIYADITDFVDREKPIYQRFEQPYVVHLQTVYQIAPLQKLFTFHHPNRSEKIDNTRYEVLSFEAELDGVLHGFSGFFDTVLYKDVILSIVPETFSTGMFSWFPIFFPFLQPVQVKKGEKIDIAVWRCENDKTVWYEWLLSSPVGGPIQNPNGRSYQIGKM